jgi:glutathione S-transferase
MKLHWSPRSPFVRLVMVAAHELGLADRIEPVARLAAMGVPNPDIMADNPLSKIPALVRDDGTVLVDSRVIVEYLDGLAGGGLIPAAGEARWRVLGRQAVAVGLLDLLVLWRNERDKPAERRTPDWLSAFAVKADATLDRFEAEAPEPGAPLEADAIALGCALSYLDFRFPERDWRAARPRLAAWHRGFAGRPSAKATEPADA